MQDNIIVNSKTYKTSGLQNQSVINSGPVAKQCLLNGVAAVVEYAVQERHSESWACDRCRKGNHIQCERRGAGGTEDWFEKNIQLTYPQIGYNKLTNRNR